MATIAQSGLYPPIIDAYLPAFITDKRVITDGLTIPFDISTYNTVDSTTDGIKTVHVSITCQDDYKSLFNSNYKRGVIINSIVKNDNNYMTTISDADIDKTEIKYNTYYKVQIRFSKDSNAGLKGDSLSSYLSNEDNFVKWSEWSTVCLIRFISQPTFKFSFNDSNYANPTVINTSNIYVSAKYTPTATDDNEYLACYRIETFLKENQVDDSGWIQNNFGINGENSEISYLIKYSFQSGDKPVVKLSYKTANLYENNDSYNLSISYSSTSWNNSNNPVDITPPVTNTVIGKNNITFIPRSSADGATIPAGLELTIRRSDNNTNFTVWDEVYYKKTQGGDRDISFDDFTIESGVIYKYEISCKNGSIRYTLKDENYCMGVFDDAFLTGEGTQLSVTFNPAISSYQHNVQDNITTTIGSQYPFVSRNAAVNYKSFQLSGTIAYEMDNQRQFASRTSIYGDYIDLYGNYFANHYIKQNNDQITQREFRERVEEFLYDGMPKLFRSTPEGNILVTLSNISFTPNQTLGRMIYDFSCTATEIGEANIQNYKLYEIQDFGD